MLEKEYTNTVFQYLTFWMVIIVFFHKLFFKYINLLFFTLFVLISSTYIYFFETPQNPIMFKIFGYPIKIMDLKTKIIIHLLFHILPFLFILFNYHDYYKSLFDISLLNITVFIIIYSILINYAKIYFTTFNIFLIYYLLSFIFYFIIITVKDFPKLKTSSN